MNPEAVAGGAVRARRIPLLAPLVGRDFRLVWFGESVSLLGDGFQLVAVSTLVLGMTGSGLALGAILLAAAIPRGVFMLLGGVLSDRISPRDLALASNVLRAAVTTVVAGLVLGDRVELWHLALAGVVFGTVDAVFLPAINTLVPRLVHADHLAAANAMMQGTGQLVGTIGPAFAGFVIAIVGVGAAFAIDAASFAVAAVALWLVRSGARPGRPPEPEPWADAADTESTPVVAPAPELPGIHAMPRQSVVSALLAGTRAMLGDPVMRSIVILSLATNFAFNGPFVIGLPWLVLIHFGADSLALGLVFAAFGLGSLAGVLVAGSLPRPRRFGTIVLAMILVMGIGLMAFGFASSVAALALIALLTGALNGYVNIVVIAWVQGRTEPEMLGRTMSFLMLGSAVALPLSLAVAGAVVDVYATAMFLLAGLLVIGAGALGIASGLPRRMV
jgi:MFS family permease